VPVAAGDFSSALRCQHPNSSRRATRHRFSESRNQLRHAEAVDLQEENSLRENSGGHHRIPENDVDRFLYRANEGGEVAERRRNFRRISGRNQLVGRVTHIKVNGLIAQVTLSPCLIGDQRITSISSRGILRSRIGWQLSLTWEARILTRHPLREST
jgi:hypothetical protein